MKIKYLGTAAAEGIPAMFCACELCEKAKRLGGKDVRMRAQMLIDDDILMDFGPDVYWFTLKYGFNLSQIKYFLITHSHGDHWIPRPFEYRIHGFSYEHIRKEFFIIGNDKIWGDPLLLTLQEKIPQKRIPAKPFEPIDFPDLKVTPLPATHMQGECALIYLIERGGKSMLYFNDSGIVGQEVDEYLREAGARIDFVSFDCTKGDMDYKYNSHMSMAECAMMRERFIKAGICGSFTRYVVTHFSHNCKYTHGELEQAARRYGFTVAYDGLEIEI